jgi:hypothetical protein
MDRWPVITVMTGHKRYRVLSNKRNPKTDPSQPMVYQIRLQGHLGRHWTEWFGGLAITLEDNGETLLTGPVVDQAALHGLLRIQSENGEQVYLDSEGETP